MKQPLLSAGCAALLAFGLAAGLRAQTPPPDSPASVAVDESATLWFVELTGTPAADGGNLNALRNEKAAFRRAATAAGVRFQERYAFDTLWNGLSVRIAPGDLSKLARIDGVKALYPVAVIDAPPQPTDDHVIELATAIQMTGADIAQNELGLTGHGVKVAVMDTGIDYDHPDLGGCFGPGCRVAMGWDFVGDAFNADSTSPSYNPVPVPDPDPDDCNGHGTHVAGIVGANGLVKGVAPGVTFGAYRVFGCTGSTFADIMIAAMERALADGMQVLNMSIGSSFQWPQYPTAAASTRLVNKKVVVVASIGNAGANGLYAASAPGVGEKVIGVASFVNTHNNAFAFAVSPDGRLVGYGTATGAPPPPSSGTYPLARTGTTSTVDDACAPLGPGSLAGHVALIRRGTCSFYIKATNAQHAGAIGVVLYNNVAGTFNPTVAGDPPITIPVVAITAADGVLIDGRIAAGPTELTWTDQVISTPISGGGLIAASSSWGLAPDLSLKPDIGAPGGNIRSTYPLESGGYATISGTSMASPHVAGAVALLLEAKPNTSHQAPRSVFLSSADPKLWTGNPGLGFLDLVHRQGAGMLDVPGTVLATTKIEPAKLSLGESEFGPVTRTLTVKNEGGTPVTYDLSHAPALATGPNTFSLSYFNAPSTVTFSVPSLAVPAGGSASVDVTIAPNPGLADRSLFGGSVVFTPQGGGDVYRVPFAGFKGDYQSIPVLVPTANNFPWLAKLIGTSYVNQPDGATFTMADGEVPYFLVHFDHQVRRVRFEVFEATSGRAWHRALDTEYFPRNSTATSFFAFSWDGVTTAGKRTYTVPNGQYVVRLSVLKALGDDDNPAHWETWTSPVVTIARP